MTVFFTSDTHFGHERILELCNRPFANVQEMNEALIHNWNSVVSPGDTVYHLGDFIMGTFAENINLIDRLNGYIRLVPGNHDRMSSAYHCKPTARGRFRKMYEDHGVAICFEESDLIVGDRFVTMCHYPYVGDSREEDRYSEFRPVDYGQWLIHGHVHDEWQINGRQINVGVDVWDYTPVPIHIILDIMAE